MNSTNKTIEKAEIIDLAVNGKGVAKSDQLTIFVSNTIPGDVADIEIFKKKRKYAEGRVTQFISFSPDRTEPACEHFGVCGGCRLQNMDYEAQLRLKQKIVRDAFQHIGHISGYEEKPIIPSANTYFYRNKLEYSFSNNKWLTNEQINSGEIIENKNAAGFHIPGLFDKILDIRHCHLQAGTTNEIRLSLKKFADENAFTFYNIRNNTGLLRSLMIRTTTTGELMVIVVFGETNSEQLLKTMNFLAEQFQSINSLYYIINLKKNDSLYDQEAVLFKGDAFIREKIGNSFFRIGPKSFFQTNSVQAEKLFQAAVELAGIGEGKSVYDLYSGVGTISLYLAGFAKKITAIETVPESVEEAKVNAALNNIQNVNFFQGEVEKILNSGFFDQNGKADIIILDPPRAGLHPAIIPVLLESGCPEIIYISCNPATQARDISLLSEKYRTVTIQPVDMFPQTLHVENIAILKSINS